MSSSFPCVKHFLYYVQSPETPDGTKSLTHWFREVTQDLLYWHANGSAAGLWLRLYAPKKPWLHSWYISLLLSQCPLRPGVHVWVWLLLGYKGSMWISPKPNIGMDEHMSALQNCESDDDPCLVGQESSLERKIWRTRGRFKTGTALQNLVQLLNNKPTNVQIVHVYITDLNTITIKIRTLHTRICDPNSTY